MSKRQDGFTLIELMIVIAIIGILASLAVSAYQTYTIRAQVTEGLGFGASAKAPITDAYNMSGEPPANRIAAGMTNAPTDSSGKYVSEVFVEDGRVDVKFGNEVHPEIFGDTISFTPYLSPSGAVMWRCGSASAPAGSRWARPVPSNNGT